MRPTGARAVRVSWLVGMLPVLAGLTLRADEPAKASPSGKPAWQRLLQGEDARKAGEQEKQLLKLQEAGKLKEALKVSESVADLRAKKQGEDHWEARDARWNVEAIRQVLRQGQAAREDYAASIALYRETGIQEDRGQFRKALPLQEKVLAIRRRVLGEDHTHTAESYNIVGNTLIYQARFGEAAEFLSVPRERC